MTRHPELESTLRRVGVIGGTDLARLLEVSPATLSRRVRAAGPRVCRMGRRRGARYALRRPVRDLPWEVPLFRVDGAGRVARIGELNPLEGGAHWLHRGEGRGVLYDGIPPFVADLQPQGFLGAAFSRRHPDLDLPERLRDWNADHALIAIARRGEDGVGNLILGEESLARLWASRERGVEAVDTSAYPELARTTVERPVGSLVGGEAPKFVAYSRDLAQHVLVKFTPGTGDAADQRWRDLLAAEAVALDTLAEYGFDTPATRLIDQAGQRFLEVVRFDRVGEHGRVGIASMASIDAEYVGHGSGWSRVADALVEARMLGDDCARRIRWLDVFGALIGNTDRHLGNISFLAPDPGAAGGQFALAPVYDMLPMTFAPAGGWVRQADYAPRAPTAGEFGIWPEAARAATDYWERMRGNARISAEFRALAEDAHQRLQALRARVEPAS